jgi:hypothetical protein
VEGGSKRVMVFYRAKRLLAVNVDSKRFKWSGAVEGVHHDHHDAVCVYTFSPFFLVPNWLP